jgi:uncharacterized protein (TIGR02145 family)
MIQVQDIDGNVYNTVWIGKQLWLAENLKVTKFRNGDPISRFYSGNYYNVATETPYYIPSSAATNYDGYGNFYNFFSIWDERELAPRGCRVADYWDWAELRDYLLDNNFSQTAAGTALASDRIATLNPHPRWEGSNQAQNLFGFNGLPNGIVYLTGLGGNPYSGNGFINLNSYYTQAAWWYRGAGGYLNILKPTTIDLINGFYFWMPHSVNATYATEPTIYSVFLGIRCLVDTNKINMML